MDSIEKVLLIFPFMPLVDLLSTFVSFAYGGQEVGFLAKPIYDAYGILGLIAWAVALFLIISSLVKWMYYIKRRAARRLVLRIEQYLIFLTLYAAFIGQAWWAQVIVSNFLIPFALSSTVIAVIKFFVPFAYIISVGLFTYDDFRELKDQMRATI